MAARSSLPATSRPHLRSLPATLSSVWPLKQGQLPASGLGTGRPGDGHRDRSARIAARLLHRSVLFSTADASSPVTGSPDDDGRPPAGRPAASGATPGEDRRECLSLTLWCSTPPAPGSQSSDEATELVSLELSDSVAAAVYRCSCRPGQPCPRPVDGLDRVLGTTRWHPLCSLWTREECRVERRPVIKTPPSSSIAELCASWGVRVSILVLASVKGSPGVTTTACLLGSTWPNADRIVVAECDPSGGDLSARFALSARQGWTSLAASIRRGASGPLGEHLQTLPGGLRVLIGSRDSSPDCARLSRHFLERGRQFTDGPWDIVADVGRIVRGDGTQTSWLGVADRVILVLRTDAGAVIHAKSWADTLPSDLKGRLALVTVGAKGYPNREIEGFTSLSVIGHLPEDREVARAVSGEPVTQRRLRRSSRNGRNGHAGRSPVPRGRLQRRRAPVQR